LENNIEWTHFSVLSPTPFSCLKIYLSWLAVSATQLNLGLLGLDHIPSIQNCLPGCLSRAWTVLWNQESV